MIRNIKKSIMFFGAAAIALLMVSTATANITYVNPNICLKISDVSELEKARDMLKGKFQTELVIDGPTLIEAGFVEYHFYLIEPPECNISELHVYWGDGDITNWYGLPSFDPSFVFDLSHNWPKEGGVYTIKASVFDVEDNEYHAELTVTVIPNDGPDNPKIKKTGTPHEYTFTSTDPEGDDIYYCIYWDFGVEGFKEYEWIGPYTSGEKAFASHTWEKGGFHRIIAESYDIHNFKCPLWGELIVFTPISYSYQYSQSSTQTQPSSQPSQPVGTTQTITGSTTLLSKTTTK